MNKTFKVVFNKARGTLMVVNEATSSVQKKGTKTVIAAAVVATVAGVSGMAMAADPTATITGTQDITTNFDRTIGDTDFAVMAHNGETIKLTGETIKLTTNGTTTRGFGARSEENNSLATHLQLGSATTQDITIVVKPDNTVGFYQGAIVGASLNRVGLSRSRFSDVQVSTPLICIP